jgi:putative phosphoesterase
MRYGIFSDVHSNLEAFEVALKFYEKERIDKFIFCGDIIGYGADPRQCLSLLKSLNPICVSGNHDWAAINKFNLNYFNPYARQALIWTKEELTASDLNYLGTFSLTHKEDNFICVHGSLDNPAQFNYIIYSYEARRSFSLLRRQIIFVGHSHRREAFCLENNKISYLNDAKIKIKPKAKYIINDGSVGQPRDGDPRLSVCVYDSDEKVVIFKRLEYNIKKAADKILAKGLSDMLAIRLFQGK